MLLSSLRMRAPLHFKACCQCLTPWTKRALYATTTRCVDRAVLRLSSAHASHSVESAGSGIRWIWLQDSFAKTAAVVGVIQDLQTAEDPMAPSCSGGLVQVTRHPTKTDAFDVNICVRSLQLSRFDLMLTVTPPALLSAGSILRAESSSQQLYNSQPSSQPSSGSQLKTGRYRADPVLIMCEKQACHDAGLFLPSGEPLRKCIIKAGSDYALAGVSAQMPCTI